MILTLDSQGVRRILERIVGMRPWGAEIGYGSTLTLEFGNPVSTPERKTHGEWRFWTYCAAWHIDQADIILAASDDEEPHLQTAVKILVEKELKQVEVAPNRVDIVLRFESGLSLKTFAVNSTEYDHWMLFMPDKQVLAAGPGQDIYLGPSDRPRPT